MSYHNNDSDADQAIRMVYDDYRKSRIKPNFYQLAIALEEAGRGKSRNEKYSKHSLSISVRYRDKSEVDLIFNIRHEYFTMEAADNENADRYSSYINGPLEISDKTYDHRADFRDVKMGIY